MYRARDQVDNEAWLEELDDIVSRLEFDDAARARARALFLSNVPETDRSKQAVLATSIYVAGLLEGDRRSQERVAEAAGVTRLTISNRWKAMLEAAGHDAPTW